MNNLEIYKEKEKGTPKRKLFLKLERDNDKDICLVIVDENGKNPIEHKGIPLGILNITKTGKLNLWSVDSQVAREECGLDIDNSGCIIVE